MKEILFNKNAKEKMLIGLNLAVDSVCGTLGPCGRNVFIDDNILPHITNDGATILNSIELEDRFENLGAWTAINASSQTNEDVGDATTTTPVLLREIVLNSLERPENPMVIKNSLQKACEEIVEELKKSSKKITLKDIKKVALISSENEEIATIVTNVINKVGENGVIIVEESRTFETSYEIQKGYEANVGFISPIFANDPSGAKAIYEKMPILCSQRKISTIGDISVLFEQLEKAKIGKIAIVCEDIDPQIAGLLAHNHANSLAKILIIRASGAVLEDISCTVGATLIGDSTGVTLDKIDINKHLGLADKIICTHKTSLFVAKTKKGEEQANRLKGQIENTQNQFEKEILAKRIAKLTGGIAVIKIGAVTDLERVYKKDKTDDTVAAVKAALAEGIVEGGGMALWRISQKMEANTVGQQILKKSITISLRQIVENCGKDYVELITKMPKGMGYDAKNDKYVNMFKAHIVDPLKAERVALTNAVSNASNFITAYCAICDKSK